MRYPAAVENPASREALFHLHLVFARGGDGPPPRFISLIEHHAREAGLHFHHCRGNDDAEAMRAAILRGELTVDLLIDYMGRSFAHDVELAEAVRGAGGIPVEDPACVRRFGSKAAMHEALARAGVALPRTIIWPAERPPRALTAMERVLLGERFVVKPARGSGGCGVSLDVDGSAESLAAALDDPDDDFLLQERVRPLELDGQPAWFRVYNCFGRVFPCFWHPETHATRLVSAEEIDRYDLHALERLSRRIGAVCGYRWFSSEIALTECEQPPRSVRHGRRQFLPIDYNNNKPLMVAQSEWGERGMPDVVVETAAWELVQQAVRRAARHEALVAV
jgi:hypothetical protein